MKKTPQLKALLEQYQSLLPEDEFVSFETEVNRLLIYYTDMLANLAPGNERGRRVHELIEEQNAASAHIKTSCQKGCGACCHLEVEITRDDANILADSMANGAVVDNVRLRELSKRVRLDGAWKMGFVESNRCVFLGADNACRNYCNRPTVCRKHSVISPVSECETVGGNPIPKLMPLAEIVMSAAVSQPGNDFGSLAKMLQLVLDERAGIMSKRSISSDLQR